MLSDVGEKNNRIRVIHFCSHIKLLSKRDYHAAIAAFSFCLRAVNFENGGTVLLFPRLLYEGIFSKKNGFEPTNLSVAKAIKWLTFLLCI